TGTAHAVPVITQAARVEEQRKTCIALFAGRTVSLADEAGTATGGGKTQVLIQARRALAGADRQWPLLRALAVEQGIAQPADIQVAAQGQSAVLVEQFFGLLEGEQAGLSGAQQVFQATGNVAGNRPVCPRLTWCG